MFWGKNEIKIHDFTLENFSDKQHHLHTHNTYNKNISLNFSFQKRFSVFLEVDYY